MASSRWKRFAFFDRHNLSLPPNVVDDVIPHETLIPISSSATYRRGGNNDNRGRGRGGGDDDDENGDNERMMGGDYFSMVVTGAALPISILPMDEESFPSLSKDDDRNAAASLGPSESDGHDDPTEAMITTLCSCASPPWNNSVIVPSSFGSGSLIASGGTGGDLGPVVVRTGGMSVSEEGRGKMEGMVDGLVLVFMSSRNTGLVHCIDVTVRCRPPEGSVGGSVGSRSTLYDSAPPPPVDNINGDLEDLDGYRGHYCPFPVAPEVAPTPQPPTSSPGTFSRSRLEERIIEEHTASTTTRREGRDRKEDNGPKGNGGRIVGLAVCSVPQTTSSGADGGRSIRVASVTDAPSSHGIAVHVDPHLRLSTSTSSSPPLGSGPGGSIYRPTSPFDTSTHGKPRCVDITPHLVTVGTDIGSVVVYAYGPSSKKRRGATGGAFSGGMFSILVVSAPPPPMRTLAVTHGNNKEKDEEESDENLGFDVSSLRLVTQSAPESNATNTRLFVTYRRRNRNRVGSAVAASSAGTTTQRNKNSSKTTKDKTAATTTSNNSKNKNAEVGRGGGGGGGSRGGVCCYDLGTIADQTSSSGSAGVSARYDLDGRDVPSSCLCDAISVVAGGEGDGINYLNPAAREADHYMVARSDGLYTYSSTDKIGVSPIDGDKIAVCAVPPPPFTKKRLSPNPAEGTLVVNEGGSMYVLVASTDSKSGRDAVDIYDATNKLVAFHVLLSPGHRALRASGVTAMATKALDGTTRGGRSSSIVLTSGGSIVTLTEKVTRDKVNLLVQKNLYTAAISMAFADPSYHPPDVTALYRRHAEHLYRKGDFSGAMDQYIFTIGSLEPSHVIFRYLDAPKIPLLVKYLEVLRSRDGGILSSQVHDELLKTCYLKLNDVESADKIAASLAKSSMGEGSSSAEVLSTLANDPMEALATISSFQAPQAAEALLVHGPTLARALPRETAGVVLTLCDGTYSPSALADAAAGASSSNSLLKLESATKDHQRPEACDRYPFHLFSSAFLEHPKLLRLLLAHCRKNNCLLTPMLQRALLELTLEEWNAAMRVGDKDVERSRRSEAMSILTDPNVGEIGDYEALVIVQLANFSEGEVLLYEKLQMAPMLLERYAQDGGDRARRQMLAMCRSDPELLADVLGYFVSMASSKINQERVTNNTNESNDSDDDDDEVEDILEDIREALYMARAQSVLPPVRIARILAGEGIGEFSGGGGGGDSTSISSSLRGGESVPLSVALDYIGAILDESSKEILRLRGDVEEYNHLCNSMEAEIKSLLSSTSPNQESNESPLPRVNIEEMYASLQKDAENGVKSEESGTVAAQEEFWREMEHSEDRFGTISRFFAKGIMH